MPITIRPFTTADAQICGRILYDAFRSIATRHHFPPDFPDVESAVAVLGLLSNLAGCSGVVAERDGRIIGSNFVSDRGAVHGVGPVSVDPTVQGSGAGRRMMAAILAHAAGAPTIRLVQDAFNTVSMPLYASLGFDVREPLVLIEGTPHGEPAIGIEVRPLEAADLPAGHALCERVHGFARRADLEMALGNFAPFVATREGRVTGYASAATFWTTNHGVAETLDDMVALLLGAARLTARPISFLLAIRDAALFRWALRAGLRVVKPLTLMTVGPYREPAGRWFPSVLY